MGTISLGKILDQQHPTLHRMMVYGSTGLIPESTSKLLEIAEFWCQYYFGQSLAQKFDKLMITNRNSIFIDDNNLM
jgi:hypothetical protein